MDNNSDRMTSEDLKKLLLPEAEKCETCGNMISGTLFDKERHKAQCLANFMQNEIQREKIARETRDGLGKELKKLL